MNNTFTIEEMENIFEVGRQMQCMIDCDHIEIEDSKEAFNFALWLAVEFEKRFDNTQDYYTELYFFMTRALLDRYGKKEE